MSQVIMGNMVGQYSQMGKTLVLVDDDGNEITGVIVGQETVFTAGAGDIRLGLVAGTEDGVTEGTREIFQYRTEKGLKVIDPGATFVIHMPENNKHQYTELQCMIAPFSDRYAITQVVLDNGVYLTSGEKVSDVTSNDQDKTIDLNIINSTEDIFLIHYFMYKEEL